MSTVPSASPDASATSRGLVNLIAQTFAGVKTFTSAIIASAGIQLALIFNTNGTAANDLVVKLGTSQTRASTDPTAALLSLRFGLTGTEVEHISFRKAETIWRIPSASSHILKLENESNPAGVGSWQIEAYPGLFFRLGNAGVTYLGLRYSDGFQYTAFGYEVNDGNLTPTTKYFRVAGGNGRIDQWGADNSGSPGATTISRPVGKAAIAVGASSVVITNSLVTASSIVLITPHARDATCKELIAVPGAGIITVSGSANATAALPFSFEVKSIL